MAIDKKSFLMYTDHRELWEEISDEQAGKLIKHILRYVDDAKPEAPDDLTKLLFFQFKQHLKRDLRKYESKKLDKSNAGIIGNLKRWHPDLHQQFTKGKVTLQEAQDIAENRKESQCDNSLAEINNPLAEIAVNDNVNDNVNVNGNDNVNEEKKNIGKAKRFSPPSQKDVYELMIEKNLTSEKAKIESEKFWNFYDSKNWYVGKNKMQKWKSSVAGWLTRAENFNKPSKSEQPKNFSTNR